VHGLPVHNWWMCQFNFQCIGSAHL